MSEVILSKYQHVLTLRLNRPDIHNAISHTSMIDSLIEALDQAQHDTDVRAVIITGEGNSFCAGGNIKDMLNQSDMFAGTEPEISDSYKNGIQRIPLALWNLDIPVIAAVNGPAIGAGCDLAMMCDIRIASEKARFAESFVKLGIIPGDGGAWFLPRIIGHARASQMALTGMMVDATTALNWGMVSEITPHETLVERATEFANAIAENPPLAVRETKKLLRQSLGIKLEDMLIQCADIQATLHKTDDHAEALRAFIEKRKGTYKGV